MNPSFTTVRDVASYSKAATHPLLSLQMQLLRPMSKFPVKDYDRALQHIALAITLTNLIRSLPANAGKKRSNVPKEIARDSLLVDEDLFKKGPASFGLQDAVFQMAELAESEITEARKLLSRFSPRINSDTMPVFLNAVRTSCMAWTHKKLTDMTRSLHNNGSADFARSSTTRLTRLCESVR